MKKLYLILPFLLPFFAVTQNWSPIRVNDTMNYKHSDSAYISHSIWVDSAFYADDDSIFYLNRIVKDVPGNPEIALRNQPQFLSLFITKQLNSVWVTSEPYGFMLKPTYPVGTQWDMWNGLQAEITLAYIDDVFGIQDSVKVISLSDGSEILISKAFGLLKFPDLENEGEFELVGIQNKAFGESVPDFWDIYGFEVGDVYQYYDNTGYLMEWGITTEKLTITGKEILEDAITFQFTGIRKIVSNLGGIMTSSFSNEVTYLQNTGNPENLFPNQIYPIQTANSDFIYSRTLLYYDTVLENTIKRFGSKEETNTPFTADVFYEINNNSDTLYRFPFVSLIEDPCGIMGVGYGNHIGKTFHSEGCFEYYTTMELQGYIKNGDTVGTITPDSLLLVHNGESIKKGSKVKTYPNPASDQLYFDIPEDGTKNLQITIFDASGHKVDQFDVSENTSIFSYKPDKLDSGMHFYHLRYSDGRVASGKFVIRR